MTITQEQLNAQGNALDEYSIFADLDAEIDAELTKAREALDEAQAALDNGDMELAEQKLAESLRHTEKAIRLIKERIGG